MSTGTISTQGLRDAMVDGLAATLADRGRALRPDVEAALRTVPRELYTPGIPAEEAYRDRAIVTKRRGAESVSSVSAPNLITEMLSQAADTLGSLEGRHVLEIGSGGYNASLLRELTGASGSVTTVDIDPDVTSRASACLQAAGYSDVTVVCADAAEPAAGRRWDLIIVTAGAWDVPAAWRTQLTGNGVLVVPWRTYGMTRSWALRRHGERLVSDSSRLCGFVAVQGAVAHEVRYIGIADGVYLRLDEDQPAGLAAAAGLLTRPRAEGWAGVKLPPQTVLADLDLWLAARLSGKTGDFAVLTADDAAIASGIIAPSWPHGTPAVLADDTLAYRSALRWDGGMFDLGAYSHGRDAAAAAARMAGHMRAWVDAGTPAPVLHVYPAQTPDGDLPAGAVLDKRHNRLVLTFNSEDQKGSLLWRRQISNWTSGLSTPALPRAGTPLTPTTTAGRATPVPIPAPAARRPTDNSVPEARPAGRASGTRPPPSGSEPPCSRQLTRP